MNRGIPEIRGKGSALWILAGYMLCIGVRTMQNQAGPIKTARSAKLTWHMVLLSICVSVVPPSSAATRTWTGSVSTDWFESNNWNGLQVPTANDDVVINSGKVTFQQNPSFANLSLNGGILSGSLVLTSTVVWAGGEVDGSWQISSNGVLNVTASFATLGSNSCVVNAGTVVQQLGLIWEWGSGTTWTNQPGSVLQLKAGALYTPWNDSDVVLHNAGTIRKAGSGRTDLNLKFVNEGLVDATEGGLALFYSVFSNGTFNVSSGASVYLQPGSYTFCPGHSVSGDGFFGINNFGSTMYYPGSVTLNGLVNSRLSWAQGWVDGSWQIASNGVLDLLGANTMLLGTNSCVVNAGTVISQPGFLWEWHPGATWTNLPGSVMQLTNGFLYTPYNHSDAVLHNAGTIRKSGSGITAMDLYCVNGGLLEVRQGQLVNGTYVQTSSGTASFCISDASATSLNPEVATLDGTLQLVLPNGISPAPGTTYPVMNFQTRIGTFHNYIGLGIRSGLRFEPEWSETSLVLQVAASSNVLSSVMTINGQRQWHFDGDPEQTMQIQASTNLQQWTTILTTNSPTGLFDFRDPEAALFEKRFYRMIFETH